MTPSRDVNEIARRHRNELPRSLRALLRILAPTTPRHLAA